MLLRAHSDAPYLSRPNSGSVAGGYQFQFLGNLNGPNAFNRPILTFSTLIPVIVASATEAEYAAVYANCILAYVARLKIWGILSPPPQSLQTTNAQLT